MQCRQANRKKNAKEQGLSNIVETKNNIFKYENKDDNDGDDYDDDDNDKEDDAMEEDAFIGAEGAGGAANKDAAEGSDKEVEQDNPEQQDVAGKKL